MLIGRSIHATRQRWPSSMLQETSDHKHAITKGGYNRLVADQSIVDIFASARLRYPPSCRKQHSNAGWHPSIPLPRLGVITSAHSRGRQPGWSWYRDVYLTFAASRPCFMFWQSGLRRLGATEKSQSGPPSVRCFCAAVACAEVVGAAVGFAGVVCAKAEDAIIRPNAIMPPIASAVYLFVEVIVRSPLS